MIIFAWILLLLAFIAFIGQLITEEQPFIPLAFMIFFVLYLLGI